MSRRRGRDGRRPDSLESSSLPSSFAIHRHDPAKVDYILAYYSKASDIDGVRVIATNKLYEERTHSAEILRAPGRRLAPRCVPNPTNCETRQEVNELWGSSLKAEPRL